MTSLQGPSGGWFGGLQRPGCEHCTGTVRPQTVEREVFKHAPGLVILEQVTIGVCDRCDSRYYSADLLYQVEEIAAGRLAPERIESIPA